MYALFKIYDKNWREMILDTIKLLTNKHTNDFKELFKRSF